jgi:hypothetical protein
MIRLRDAKAGELIRLEPLEAGRVTVLAPAPADDPSARVSTRDRASSGQVLAAYRVELTADLLRRLLERLGLAVRRIAAPDGGRPDVALASADGGSEDLARDGAGCLLAVGGVLLDGRPVKASSEECSLRTILARGVAPAALRYFGLTAHYRAPWSFSWAGLAGAGCALEVLLARLQELAEADAPLGEALSPNARALQERFFAALADDLDLPSGLETLWRVVHGDLPPAERRALLLDFDSVLGLDLATAAPPTDELPPGAQELIDQRAAARRARDWARSDELRERLEALEVETQDTPQGSTYRRRATSSR